MPRLRHRGSRRTHYPGTPTSEIRPTNTLGGPAMGAVSARIMFGVPIMSPAIAFVEKANMPGVIERRQECIIR